MRQLIIDIATAPLADVQTYLEGAISAPSNYKDAEKIAAYIAEKQAERVAGAALDLDLCRITGIGTKGYELEQISICRTEDDECFHLSALANELSDRHVKVAIITYGGFNFDLPVLMRRAKYLGVNFPALNLDRYRSPHTDLCDLLSDRNPQRRRSLGFYAKRLGWSDISKPLSGAEESRVHETGDWDGLEASIKHDITATYRLALWAGVMSEELVAL